MLADRLTVEVEANPPARCHVAAPPKRFIVRLLRCLDAGEFDERDSDYFTQQWRFDPRSAAGQLARFWDLTREGGVIIRAAESASWEPVLASMSALRKAIAPRHGLWRGRADALRAAMERALRPPGLFVACLGPDGSGKSSIIAALEGATAETVHRRRHDAAAARSAATENRRADRARQAATAARAARHGGQADDVRRGLLARLLRFASARCLCARCWSSRTATTTTSWSIRCVIGCTGRAPSRVRCCRGFRARTSGSSSMRLRTSWRAASRDVPADESRRLARRISTCPARTRECRRARCAVNRSNRSWQRPNAPSWRSWRAGPPAVAACPYTRRTTRAAPDVLLFFCRRQIPVLSRLVRVAFNSDIHCRIPDDLHLPHPYGIVMHPQAAIGNRVTVMQQVTIGSKDRRRQRRARHR